MLKTMLAEQLSDRQLVDAIRHGGRVDQALVDSYYQRCIPLYLDFIGPYWHTGYYSNDDQAASIADQQRMLRVVADSIQLSNRDSVLDVGCGIGSSAIYLAKKYASKLTGLTPVAAQKQIAGQLVSQSDCADLVTIDIGHADTLNYPDAHFDVVLFFESPCHFVDRQAFFNEAFRVLKPGGRLAGEDWLHIQKDDTAGTRQHIESICRDWAIPMLGDSLQYQQQIRAAGFERLDARDLRSEAYLDKGFSVTPAQQQSLQLDIDHCTDPLLEMTLHGLLSLGRALASGCFTIGRFSAHKPATG